MLRAGAAKLNITPFIGCAMGGYGARDRGSDSISDDLRTEALVHDDGRTALAIVTADLVNVTRELCDAVAASVKRRVGIDGAQLLISATHTHFGPETRHDRIDPKLASADIQKQYLAVLAEYMASAVELAFNSREPARIGCGFTRVTGLVYNRRLQRRDGKVQVVFRLPLPDSTLTFGPDDPELGVIKVESERGAPIATVLNFACHPVTNTDRMYALSADFPGHAKRMVESERGGVCLFALGCAGNQVPMVRQGDAALKMGRALAEAALKLGISTKNAAELRATREELELPRLESKQTEHASKTMSAPLQALKIGEISILAFPGEIFVETGLALKSAVERAPLFFFTMANDTIGYVPIRDAYPRGGYEVEVTNLAPGAAEQLEASALVAIGRLVD